MTATLHCLGCVAGLNRRPSGRCAREKKNCNGKKPVNDLIEVVKSSYQPSKAELEEDLRINRTFEELAKAALQPVKINYLDRPKSES